ncbi:MAG: response regulator transcription factor [Alphaproteobacteria bacterium]|nr:response regulator transcription factor [Alphaproteobacteria bacterium]
MGASTIVVARADLSIPGAVDAGSVSEPCGYTIEANFFAILRQHNPDVIVLDLTEPTDTGVAAIVKIRGQSVVPIVVVCRADDVQLREYRLAGAAECMQAPIDIMQLNATVQKIIQLSMAAGASRSEPQQTQPALFAGLTLEPSYNRLRGGDGASVKLTTSENRVLIHFVNNPRRLCTREDLAEMLYGPHRPNSDRAVDVIVTRLRKKIASLGGGPAQGVIKTEFRRGYMFIADVEFIAPIAMDSPGPLLTARSA